MIKNVHYENIKEILKKIKLLMVICFKKFFSEGFPDKMPFDLIIIDCPQYNINLDLLKSNKCGR